MKNALLLPILCVITSMASASPWEDFVQRRRSLDPRTARWTLCVRQGDFSNLDAFQDPIFQRLLTSGDFSLEILGAAVAQDLWARKGWGREPHWLVLAPGGDELAQGSGRPKGAEALDGIHRSGAQLRWEARAAFLKAHPDHGEALLESVNQAFQILRLRLLVLDRTGKVKIPAWHQDPAQLRAQVVSARISLPPGPQGEALADDLYREVAEALEPLLRLPGWEQEASLLANQLSTWDAGQSSRMRKLIGQAADSLQVQFRRDPYDLDLANFWMEAADASGQSLGDPGGFCLPVPGVPWPDPGLLSRLLEPSYRRKDWDGALKLLADLAPSGPPEPMTAPGWESYCRLQGALLSQRALALAGLGSWDLAGAALSEGKRWSGSGGVREALLQRGSLFTGPGGEPNAWRQLLSQALGRDGGPPPMPPLAAPLRLVISGMPTWKLAFTDLRLAPELAPWSPAELHWEVADAGRHEEHRAAHGWPPGPRWILFRGEELRGTGTACPSARALAGVLEAEGPTQLQRLQAVLDAQPDHLAARRERFEQLLKRMPDRRLEETLAEDAAQLLATLEFDPQASWKPDPDIWAVAAITALPALEAELLAWPNRSYLWRAWVSWARFHPAHPSALALAQRVAFWSPRLDWRALLPYAVQREVAAELRRQGNFPAMRDWFRAVWESLDRRPLRVLHVGERQWVLERRREEESAVFRPLREALGALNCIEEQAELERVFAEMMGRDVSRRR